LAASVSNASYDLTNPQSPNLTFDENLQDLFFPVKLLVDAIGGLTTETDQFKIDLTNDNSRGVLKFGFKYDSRDAIGGGAPLATVAKGFPAVDIASAEMGPWTTSFNNSIGGYYTDNAAIRRAAEAAGASRANFPEDEMITIEEVILAAYVMQTFDMDWGNVIVGVRIEDTEYDTVGSRLVGAVAEPLTVSKSYTNVLPSAHVNWDLDDDRKVRLSFSSGISRPSYIESRAAADISEVAMSVSGGNPNLEEETSWGIDLAYEWYFAEASIFSATIFYRSIDNVISESSEKVLGSIYSDIAMDGELWDLQGFGNGSDGKLNGLELAFTGRLDNYIEGFFSGFGIEANATFIDSEYTTPGGLTFELPGQSDATYNFSVFYEDHGLSARLSYRYRDAWLDETETSSVFGLAEGIYWDEQSRVDLSVRYDLEPLINQKVSLFLDMNNLTDETDVRYTGALWNPNQVEAYGRRYVAGFRYSL